MLADEKRFPFYSFRGPHFDLSALTPGHFLTDRIFGKDGAKST